MRITVPETAEWPFGDRSEMSSDEYRALVSGQWSGGIIIPPADETAPDWMANERAFQHKVDDYARGHNWRGYHTWNSANSSPGFPDWIGLRVPRLVVAELKVGPNKPTKDQQWWLDNLRALSIVTIEVYLWRPEMWSEIAEILR